MSTVTSSASARHPRLIELLVLFVAVVLTIVLGLMLPGLGLVVAAGFAFTVWRDDRRKRNALLALGVAITVVSITLAIVANVPGTIQLQKSKPTIVQPR